MAGYCIDTDIIQRLGEQTVVLLVNDESTDFQRPYDPLTDGVKVNAFIEDISVEIDMCVGTIFNNPRDLVGNQWLKVACVNVTCERLFERRGQGVPISIQTASRRSRDTLELIRDKKLRIPNTNYPGDGYQVQNRRRGLPLISNGPQRGGTNIWRPPY